MLVTSYQTYNPLVGHNPHFGTRCGTESALSLNFWKYKECEGAARSSDVPRGAAHSWVVIAAGKANGGENSRCADPTEAERCVRVPERGGFAAHSSAPSLQVNFTQGR